MSDIEPYSGEEDQLEDAVFNKAYSDNSSLDEEDDEENNNHEVINKYLNDNYDEENIQDDDDDDVDNLQLAENSNESDTSSSLVLSESPALTLDQEGESSPLPDNIRITKDEELKMIYLRSFLNRIEKNFEEKDLVHKKYADESRSCKQKILSLERKRDEIFHKIEQAQNENNITIINRLSAEHANICKEIELENEVLNKISQLLETADYERNKALLEKSKYIVADDTLKKKEQILARQKAIRAQARLESEEKKVDYVKKNYEKQKKMEIERIREIDMKNRYAIEQAKQSRQNAAQYLKKTLRELKEKGESQKVKQQLEFDKKQKSLLQLKETLDHNKEVLRVKLNKQHFNQVKQEITLINEKNEIFERGENPDFYIPRKQKMEEVNKMKENFLLKQKKNTEEIVKKILKENSNIEKKKQLYPDLFNTRKVKLPDTTEYDMKKSFRTFKNLANKVGYSEEEIQLLQAEIGYNDEENQEEMDRIERTSFFESTTVASKDDDSSDFDELDEQEENLAKPEFDGLWNAKFEKYDAAEFNNQRKKFPTCFKTKMEQEIFLQTLEKLKNSKVKEQVVSGKKFKGVAFKSQPKIIHFKDFDVGSSYKIKVVLTNISYTTNTCKYIGMTEKLKDFINFDFKPPGQLSAGLTCEFTITFEPKINEDLSGEIQFLATNGPFSVPILCTIKKCDISVDNHVVDFGTTVIQDKVERKISLVNKGALGTNFKIISKKSLDIQQDENACEEESQDAIQLGQIQSGFLAPFSNVSVDFTFLPIFPGKFKDEFVIKFDDQNSKEITLQAKGLSIDVPIWLENTNIDLKICMYDRLYQEVIKVHNRASAALRITFEIPNELKNHMEILPKTAFIQAKSEFSAQLKFIARPTLVQDATEYFDFETGVLEVPLHIKVADQTKVVNYSLNAVVTTSDLEFNVNYIDFGHCTIYESVRANVKLTNKSILCQPFGFVKLPEFVDVQPNDGFGTLLPNETIDIFIHFSPKTAKEFDFKIICKSLVNRDFIINCKGIGVHPPLKLSSQAVYFPATALGDTSYVNVYVVNDHTDYEEHRHPCPRIGNGEIQRVAPTYFEFDLPEDFPFSLSPSVGVVKPGERVKVSLKYTAKLGDYAIKEQSAKLKKNKMIEQVKKKIAELAQETASQEIQIEKQVKQSKRASAAPKPAKNANDGTSSENSISEIKTPDPLSIEKNSQDYYAGQASLFCSFDGAVKRYQVPCFVKIEGDDGLLLENTLYLDVVCPSIKPELIITSNDSSSIIDFGSITLGQSIIKHINIQNISESTVDLDNDYLDPFGPFSVLNAPRSIEPGGTHRVIINFAPTKVSLFQESLNITTGSSTLHIFLKGVGVEPSVSLSIEGNPIGNVIDFGYSLAGEKNEKIIQIQNNSKLTIDYKLSLDSQNSTLVAENEKKRAQHKHDLTYRSPIGPNNYGGTSPFDVVPIEGSISPGQKKQVTVIFNPDHQSDLYADVLRLSLSSNDEATKIIQLIGKAKNHTVYVKGAEQVVNTANYETLVLNEIEPEARIPEDALKLSKDVEDSIKIPNPLIVNLYSCARNDDYTVAEKIITFGCLKTNSINPAKKDVKKNGDFSFDALKEINAKGFNIDITKSAIESGGEKDVKITWKPLANTDPNSTTQASILVTTKGDIVETWKLILKGRIVSDDDFTDSSMKSLKS